MTGADVDLPDTCLLRPLSMADATSVAAVLRADEVAALGKPLTDPADIVADWGRPSFDLAGSTVGVFQDDLLIGYAEVDAFGRGNAAVGPEHHGRGIGTALARWMQATARARGLREVGMPVPARSTAEALLRELGYHTRWTSWVLALPDGTTVPEHPLPTGCTLRRAGPDDVEATYRVIETAFGEWSARAEQSYADWYASVIERPGFEPWNLQVVLDPEGAVIGGVHVVLDQGGVCGFVEKVAVRADHRGRGLARALLAAAFAATRIAGATRAELSTDSRTGALGLYLGLGMEIDSTWVNLGIDL